MREAKGSIMMMADATGRQQLCNKSREQPVGWNRMGDSKGDISKGRLRKLIREVLKKLVRDTKQLQKMKSWQQLFTVETRKAIKEKKQKKIHE